MENVTHALYMAAAFLMFIGAFTYSLYMVNKLNTTAKTLVYRLDETNYYDSLDLTSLLTSAGENKAYKEVSAESIIPTLYKYYKESYTVKIVDTNGNIIQLFDTTIEGKVMTATSKLASQRTDEEKALISLYGTPGVARYMYGAPWLGSTNKDAKERIDMFIAGKSGYINNTFVDYTNDHFPDENGNYRNLAHYLEKDANGNYIYKFKEIFSEYTYEGDTITSEDGDETLTGTKQTSSKIVITYQLMN